MKYINPKLYSKSKTNKAAEHLCNFTGNYKDISKTESNYLKIMDNWRSAHNYPLSIFIKRLKRITKVADSKSICSQRLKRMPSIIKKLNRSYVGNEPTMRYTQMQDIAGCRCVVSTLKKVNTVYDIYLKNGLRHKLVNKKDYVSNPKSDGYRCIHLVYRFVSDKGKQNYNGLLVEIQIRSKLQHLWATAVETVDFFTNQAIKSNQGDKDWKDFFKLVSSAFAKLEKSSTIVEDTPNNEKELCLCIKEKEAKLNAIKNMKLWTKSIKSFDDLKNKKQDTAFFLLELDAGLNRLNISAYSKAEEAKALADYAYSEQKIYGRTECDVVLVGVDNLVDLKEAYPNYFLDTAEFIKRLERILKKY